MGKYQVNNSTIPEILRKINNWVCWKYEQRDGKLTKVPKHPATGKNAKSDDPDTWTGYEIAVENKIYFDGIGFMLQPEKIDLVGIDIDHCLNGSLSPFATEIVTAVNSYTEVTPSGEGLRIFALGALPPKKRKKADFEVYTSRRFLSVTGNHYPGTPLTIERREAEITTLHQKIFGDQPEETRAPAAIQPVSLGDIELLNVILQSKQAPKFTKLWAGKWTGDYSSQSEADLALCSILAFYTGNDETRIDNLFRQSGLWRDKWDKSHSADDKTYGQMTISQSYSTEVYQPPLNISITDIILNVPEQPETEEKITSWADLDSQLGPIVWDWPGWIARGFQILVASVPGEGKSNLILHIARVYLTGSLWPDLAMFKDEPGKILWVETESAQALNLERAKKWNLPLDRIITPLDDPMSNTSLDDKEHLTAIYHKAQNPDVQLIIVDSLSGGTRREAKNSNEMLGVGGFLADLAKMTGKPVLVSHHLNKTRNGSDFVTLDRVRDSSAIVQLARVVWAIDTPDAEKPESKRLYCIKNNLIKFPKPMGFEITETGLNFTTDAPKPPKREGQEERAIEMLRNYLIARNNNVPAAEIDELAKIERISFSTLQRAKVRLNIISNKSGGMWYWSLPTNLEVI